ncbi:MAG: RNA methyltransferase [Gemmatimonadota bacterium]|nr:RNA methyltransferase [Gemmatimonadota bacterium]MDE2873062.1 RNA methyltransferase [Gemmatimonadota bacterium]
MTGGAGEGEGAVNRISQSKRRLARRLRSRRGREREGSALVEGPGLVGEALMSPVAVRWVLVGEEYGTRERGRAIVARCADDGVEADVAPDGEVRDLCSTDAPQPVVACVRPPPLESRSLERGRYLLAGGVQMPGNLGTLIRSAWAFGLDGAVIGAGTVDPWNPKVVRASAGAVFHLALIGEPAGLVGDGDRGGANEAGRLNVLRADAGGEPPEEVDEARARDWVLVVGNEGGGISPPLGCRGRAVAVPLAAGVDSLNVAVAGSILMYELMRIGGAEDGRSAPNGGGRT